MSDMAKRFLTLLITMVLVLLMYWDLSHPGQGNIVLNYAMSAYK